MRIKDVVVLKNVSELVPGELFSWSNFHDRYLGFAISQEGERCKVLLLGKGNETSHEGTKLYNDELVISFGNDWILEPIHKWQNIIVPGEGREIGKVIITKDGVYLKYRFTPHGGFVEDAWINPADLSVIQYPPQDRAVPSGYAIWRNMEDSLETKEPLFVMMSAPVQA
ncbi:hypothetical protein [Falsirhodobacter halotolerans]|uniref:hypothetical protein n=1 Tax=Falsirhodobacter halotolerans TaxID=1146892 RepID=UPI001FD5A7C0|nr:hypothetical protein [Falsirhodobacter halotolerans]MCJ8139330.1 hypothetical protein [Falsirhodobacter halotolerans]